MSWRLSSCGDAVSCSAASVPWLMLVTTTASSLRWSLRYGILNAGSINPIFWFKLMPHMLLTPRPLSDHFYHKVATYCSPSFVEAVRRRPPNPRRCHRHQCPRYLVQHIQRCAPAPSSKEACCPPPSLSCSSGVQVDSPGL